ncbi:MAG TPA: hypothetical protein VNJ29_02150 [Candidatus Nitrosotenuis sp.]|nr:hypothetical protein [Candidatus Nitrosotenuis sp.]
MKSAIITLLISFVIYEVSSAQILPKKFWNLLQENKMMYSLPSGFVQTPIITNSDVEYDFAIKSKDKKMEIRYKIWPIIRPEQNSNNMSDAMLLTMALNISNGKMVTPNQFPEQSVKEEFGADKGSTTMVPTDSEFGKGYKMCMINVIHKENVADAYTFYLFDDPKTLIQVMGNMAVFHALKFK